MHGCLRIPEILATIFESVDRRALLTLIQTCQTFNGPALRILWRTIYNPIPLLLTMPQDLLVGEDVDEDDDGLGRARTLTFKRDPNPKDWERFDQLASLVQRMGFQDLIGRSWTNIFVLSHRICRALAQRSLQMPLLPSLQSVNVFSNDLPYIAFFLNSDVRDIRLTMNPDFVTPLSILAAEIPLRAPNLRTLQLVESTPWSAPAKRLFKPGLSKLLYTPNLEVFDCDFLELDDELTWCLLTMPHLRAVRLSAGMHTLKKGLLKHRLRESQMTSFRLSCDTFTDNALAPIVGLLCPSELINLEMTFTAASCHPSVDDLSSFIAVVGKQCSPARLTDLKLDTTGTHPPEANFHSAAIDFRMIAPLVPFSQLQNLTFSAHPFNLTDNEIKVLAMAWPVLETLCVSTSYLFDTPPQASLKGLLWLATYCRRLRSLEFRFSEARGKVLPEEMAAAANHSLSFLSVGSSVIENPDSVARFITCIFPTLSLLMFSHPVGDVNRDRWDEVQSRIQWA